jgi:phosphotriesterase-related protein
MLVSLIPDVEASPKCIGALCEVVPMTWARTVLGDVDIGTLGVVLAHEHLIIDSPVVERDHPHIHLPSADEAISEAAVLSGAGIGTVVDAMPVGSGGDPARLARVAEVTGLNVIASTGMHTARYYEDDDWRLSASPDELASEFIAGIEAPGTPAGVIKIAMSGTSPNAMEGRLYEAAAITAGATGAPVLAHCEGGEGGLAQVDLLTALDMPLNMVALSHTDKVADTGYHRALLDTGVLLCFDQGLREPEHTAGLIADLTGAGYGDRLLIGTDGARRSLWSTLGGAPGLAWIMTGFRDLLMERGLDAATLDRLYRDNPARWLAFTR